MSERVERTSVGDDLAQGVGGRKRLLIVTPHFPPTDAVDMHRVRMNVRHYQEQGWDTKVLCVECASVDRVTDPSLVETLPADLDVQRVGAVPLGIAKVFGASDIALRSFGHLRTAGDKIVKAWRPDLVLFSTTAFLVMSLGARWRRKFGVPFVLDFQDPWFAAPPTTMAFRRKGLKHNLMRNLHRHVEARTVPFASGILSVSEAYVEALRVAYPALGDVPAEVVPFGFAEADFAVAKRSGQAWTPFGDTSGAPSGLITCLYAGRIAPAMERSLDTFLAAVARARTRSLRPLDGMRAAFVGTGYLTGQNVAVAASHAAKFELGAQVIENPDRLSLLDTLVTLQTFDTLLIFGSDDLAYQPSKLFQYLSLPIPIICVAPAGGRLAKLVAGLQSVVFLPTGGADLDGVLQEAATKLARLLADPSGLAYAERVGLAEKYNAKSLAAKECALFERAVQFGRPKP